MKDKFIQKGVYEINTYTSGEECLKNLNLKPDIVVLDYHLTDDDSKGLNGHHVLEIIMHKLLRTKVIMIFGDEKIQLLSSDFNSNFSNFTLNKKKKSMLTSVGAPRAESKGEKVRKVFTTTA